MTIVRTDGTVLRLPTGQEIPCAMGRSGLVAADRKREGDGATPIGRWRLTQVRYRSDRVAAPLTSLPLKPITLQDGWCDDPADHDYNRAVTLPFAASHEVLWRKDGLYDLLVETDHNADPPVPGLGSAIFLHCRNPNGAPTAGCIAIDPAALVQLLQSLDAPAWLDIAETL